MLFRAQRGLSDGWGRRGLRESDDTEGAALSAPWLGRHGGRPSSFGLILLGELRRVGGMEEVGRRRPVHQDLHEGFNKPVVVEIWARRGR